MEEYYKKHLDLKNKHFEDAMANKTYSDSHKTYNEEQMCIYAITDDKMPSCTFDILAGREYNAQYFC